MVLLPLTVICLLQAPLLGVAAPFTTGHSPLVAVSKSFPQEHSIFILWTEMQNGRLWEKQWELPTGTQSEDRQK